MTFGEQTDCTATPWGDSDIDTATYYPPDQHRLARALRWWCVRRNRMSRCRPCKCRPCRIRPASRSNSKATALMVLDYVEDICATQPKCRAQMLPAITPFMERVRKAGLSSWHTAPEHRT